MPWLPNFLGPGQFVTSLHGWNIYTSNRLPEITAETLTLADGSASQAVSGKANIFMCIGDDQVKPGMMAWRQEPRVETEREVKKKERDDYLDNIIKGDKQ